MQINFHVIKTHLFLCLVFYDTTFEKNMFSLMIHKKTHKLHFQLLCFEAVHTIQNNKFIFLKTISKFQAIIF